MAAPDFIPDLLKAVNDASGKAFALWITFLTVTVYLAISIGTTTHLQLLLAGPVQLPLLGVSMPLFAFYIFAPPMFVVLHLYVLMQLCPLARLLRLFDRELWVAELSEPDLDRLRGQLDKFVFTHFLIGAPQNSTVRVFLSAIVWSGFVIGPVLLLIGFQLRFLPYHDDCVTLIHIVTAMIDVVFICLLWSEILTGSVVPKSLLLALPIIIATVFCLWVYLPPSFRNIHLPRERTFDLDEDKLSKTLVTLRLSERDLRYSDLRSSDLRKADLYRGDLSNANLNSANLSDADLISANLSSANLTGADLTRANLTGASLTGANLNSANLTDAHDLTQSQLDTACGKPRALPSGLTLDKPCPP